MTDLTPKRGFSWRLRRAVSFPFRLIIGSLVELIVNLKEIMLMMVPAWGSGRRNREFEKSGRESQRVVRRKADGAVFRKGELDRKRELVEAEREARKFANSNSEEAVHYREQVEQRKLEVSRGEIVNHLAQMNAKHRKSSKSVAKPEEDDQTQEE